MGTGRITLVLASNHPAKLQTFRRVLAHLPIDLQPMASALPSPVHISQGESTLEGNARKKCRVVAEATMMLTLADDAGIEVDALGGRPGVRSSCFAHERATFAENNAALLAALEAVEPHARTARLRCALALVDPWSPRGLEPFTTEGSCEGRIAQRGQGAGGFGYDPIFIAEGQDRTLAELSDDERFEHSPRVRAARALLPLLHDIVQARLEEAARVGRVHSSIRLAPPSQESPAQPAPPSRRDPRT